MERPPSSVVLQRLTLSHRLSSLSDWNSCRDQNRRTEPAFCFFHYYFIFSPPFPSSLSLSFSPHLLYPSFSSPLKKILGGKNPLENSQRLFSPCSLKTLSIVLQTQCSVSVTQNSKARSAHAKTQLQLLAWLLVYRCSSLSG